MSLQLTPGKTAVAAVPNASPYRGLGSITIDLRAHDVIAPNPPWYSDIVTMPGFRILWHVAPSTILICDDADTFPPGVGTCLQVNVGTASEFLLRARRDVEKKQITAETWDAAGGNYKLTGPLNFSTTNPLNLNGTLTIGGAQTQMNLAYVRVYSGVNPLNSRPPAGGANGNLFDYELEGNGNDSSGNSCCNLSLFSGASFTATPLYSPKPIISLTSRVVRAGVAQKLDGSLSFSPNDGAPLQFTWEYMSGPQGTLLPRWKNANTATPTLNGLIFGTHTIRLSVKDASGREASLEQDIGAVATDEKGVVVTAQSYIDSILGPLTILGSSPWPYFDDRHIGMADHFGALQSSLYLDTWNTPLAGTVSVAVNGTTVTGVGTSFKSTFCSGGSASDGSGIVLFYPRTDGSMGRRWMGVGSCASDTQMTISPAYYFGAAANGIQYSRWVPDGTWINGSSNANYYDNVAAFYSLYYRTGLTRYRDYARTLADRWWSNPFHDGGFTCDGISGLWCVFPRVRSLLGIYLRAMDGKPEYFPGLRANVGAAMGDMTAQAGALYMWDMREQAYELAFVSLCALLDPDATASGNCANAVETEVARWKGLQQTDPNTGTKYWLSPTYGNASWNSQGGTTVAVTLGSAEVTGTGTNFSVCNPGDAFRSTNAWGEAFNGDTGQYFIRSVDSPTQIQLDRPYGGPTAANRGWQCGPLVGNGVQPFMMGIVGTAMSFAERALAMRGRLAAASDARQMVLDTGSWVRKDGFRPATRGLWYGRYYSNCEPIGEQAYAACRSGDVIASREYAIETLNTNSQEYLRTQRLSDLPFMDAIFGGIFGKGGGPGADGNYSAEIDTNGFYLQINNAKYFGFLYGFGLSPSWLGARLGGVDAEPAQGATLWGVKLSAVPGAVSARLTVTKPTGETVTVVCTGNPCRLPTDSRLGSHWVQVEYVLGNGEVISDPNAHLVDGVSKQ